MTNSHSAEPNGQQYLIDSEQICVAFSPLRCTSFLAFYRQNTWLVQASTVRLHSVQSHNILCTRCMCFHCDWGRANQFHVFFFWKYLFDFCLYRYVLKQLILRKKYSSTKNYGTCNSSIFGKCICDYSWMNKIRFDSSSFHLTNSCSVIVPLINC